MYNDSTVVLVMTSEREAATRNHLEQLIRYRPSASAFPIIISQDGVNTRVTSVISEFVDRGNNIGFIHHAHRIPANTSQKSAKNYFYISQHYKWALNKIFFEMNHKIAIITEDDLDIAEDFFSYFLATRHLLSDDPTIWCISAWNDNGRSNITNKIRSDLMYRTDFFPGLGWMLTAKLWKEIVSEWPDAYWDDWLRTQKVRKNRVCIRPEISRTMHNNKLAGKGSSGGMYKSYLESIRLPESAVDFSSFDSSYLVKENYDKILMHSIDNARSVSLKELHLLTEQLNDSFRIVYRTPREYRNLAKSLGLMLDIRSGMPRTAYYGIVTLLFKGSRVYLLPALFEVNIDLSIASSSAYNETWDKMTKFLEFEEIICKPGRFIGRCDPKNSFLIEWFKKKRLSKRLEAWKDVIIN